MIQFSERPRFSAPLLPGVKSYIQQYYRLSRWLTIPILMFMMIGLVFLHGVLASIWLFALVVLIPVNFLVIHHLLVKMLVQVDEKRWNQNKIVITPDAIRVYRPKGEVHEFPFHRISDIKLIYSGFERAFIPSAKHFSGGNNELSFKMGGHDYSFRFRLISPQHRQKLLNLLEDWYATERDFEEYNRTSGLPMQSNRLELN